MIFIKKKYFAEVVFLHCFPKKSYVRKSNVCVLACVGFLFLKASWSTVKRNDNVLLFGTFRWYNRLNDRYFIQVFILSHPVKGLTLATHFRVSARASSLYWPAVLKINFNFTSRLRMIKSKVHSKFRQGSGWKCTSTHSSICVWNTEHFFLFPLAY